uniref:Uncharacterized protein n=1 Tax=Chenopodium quinoa TaxID=63459 RepID=A0A803MU77_CHEQI
MVKVKHVAVKPNKRPRPGAPIVGLEKATPPPTRKSARTASTSKAPPPPTDPDTSSDDEPEPEPRFKSTLYREMYYKSFTNRTICECRHVDFDSLNKAHAVFIRQWFKHQQWDKLLTEKHPIYPDLVRQFYTHFDHANKNEEVIITWVKGKEIKLDENSLSRILKIPRAGVRAVLRVKNGAPSRNLIIRKVSILCLIKMTLSRDPEVQVADDGDDEVEVDGGPYASSTNAGILESIVVQEMLKRMRPDLFTADVMSDIRESAQIILDARNEAAVPNPFVSKVENSPFDSGIYLRIDVPGANEFEITRNNIQEDSISYAVFEFVAKAPSYEILWKNLDEYKRSYGGRVKVPMDYQVSKAMQTKQSHSQSAPEMGGLSASKVQGAVSGKSKGRKGSKLAHLPHVSLGTMDGFTLHQPECSCCNGEKISLEAAHILDSVADENLFKIRGFGEVCEKKLQCNNALVILEDYFVLWVLYVRFDLPGIDGDQYEIKESQKCFVYGMLMARFTYEGMRLAKEDKRAFVLTYSSWIYRQPKVCCNMD